MSPRTKSIAIQRILMEPLPLLKRLFGICLVLLGIPDQHLGFVLNACGLAECLDDAGGVVEQVVGVDDADFDSAGVAVGGGGGGISAGRRLPREIGPDLACVAEVVKEDAEFFVAGFVGAEVVEAGHFVERGDCAAVVAGDAVARVAD